MLNYIYRFYKNRNSIAIGGKEKIFLEMIANFSCDCTRMSRLAAVPAAEEISREDAKK